MTARSGVAGMVVRGGVCGVDLSDVVGLEVKGCLGVGVEIGGGIFVGGMAGVMA